MNHIESPKSTSECLDQLKILGCELSLQTLRSYAAKALIPKAVREGGGRGTESLWDPYTVPEAVAASELLRHQRMNFERAAQIRRMGRHIEKIIESNAPEKALFEDLMLRKFVLGDQVTAFRVSFWVRCKWNAITQLYSPQSRQREIQYRIVRYLTVSLMEIANGNTEPPKGELVSDD